MIEKEKLSESVKEEIFNKLYERLVVGIEQYRISEKISEEQAIKIFHQIKNEFIKGKMNEEVLELLYLKEFKPEYLYFKISKDKQNKYFYRLCLKVSEFEPINTDDLKNKYK